MGILFEHTHAIIGIIYPVLNEYFYDVYSINACISAYLEFIEL